MIEPRTKSTTDSLEILTSKINELAHKMDSVMQVNRDLMVNKNYFSDVIDTQMDWFAMIFVITFGILGLAYWLGIFKYFNNKFRKLDNDIKLSRNSLLARIAQKEKDSKTSISSNYTILDNKISSLEKLQNELSSQRYNSIDQNIVKLQNEISELIAKTEIDIKSIIEEQNVAFKSEKDELLQNLYETNFNTNRSMFFYCHGQKLYSAALTWILPMLKMIAEKQVEYELDSFSDLAIECIQEMTIDETINSGFDTYIQVIDEIERVLDADDLKTKIRELKFQFNKAYYTNAQGNEENK